ncbi:MAG: type II toxin-antitoxin system RelE/ParE family toxin [Gammaproteobacteria bacterium]|nr:type II toxin-antitoxin system RelE/ParE family toxin [Gammaproteobacteria bacterium]
MLNITKRPLAKEDLKGIWRYTYKHWGERQADKYLNELGHAIDRLVNNPEIGISCPYVNAEYRQYSIKHHIIFYRIEETAIVIVRVLHERMDPNRHL